MREIVEVSVAAVVPGEGIVLDAMGVASPPKNQPSVKVAELIKRAMDDFTRLSKPVGLVQSISIDEFASIHRGEGRNEPETPLEKIYPRADELALFVATLGPAVSERIAELFRENDFAFGYALDAVASAGADGLADRVEERAGELSADPVRRHLRYSPGYCGWHISGQKKLFEVLHPEDIGVKLNDSYLMQPLKSVSGVIVSGRKEIHLFKSDYPFCAECATGSCRERFKTVMKN